MEAGADRMRCSTMSVIGGVLAEHQAGVEAGLVGEEVGQPLRQRRVGQPVQPPLRQHRHHRDGRAGHVHRQGTGRALEVRAGQRQLQLGHEDRVVAHAVQLDLDLRARVGDGVAGGADHLRRRTHRVGVLHLGLHLAGRQVRALDDLHDVLGRGDGAREAAQFVQRRVVRLQVAEQRLDRHGGGDLGLLEPALHVVDVQRRHGRQQVRAVDGGQAVARLQAGHA